MNIVVSVITASILCLTAVFRPDVAIRLIFLTAILAVGTVFYFFPQYNYIGWGVGFSGFFLIILSFIHFLSKSRTPLDRISLSLVAFTVSLIIPIVSNINNPIQIIAFGKNIVQYWGFVPLAALGFIDLKSRNKIVKYILVIIFIQAVVSIYQAVFIVNWANRIAGGDSVVGTFGGTPDGGGSSGAQTIFLSVIISVALATYICNQLRLAFLVPILVVALIPISLNETKVFFVLIPIALLYFLVTGFTRYPVRTVQVTLIGMLLILFIFTIYIFYLQHGYGRKNDASISEYTESMENSSTGFYIGKGREASGSRLGSIKFWWVMQTKNDHILELFFGYGLGASKVGGVFPGRLVDVGGPYHGLILDRTGLSCLLWDIGIVGTILFYLIFLSGWSLAVKSRKQSNSSAFEKSILWGIESGIILLALSNIYDKYFFTNPGLNAFTLLVFAFVVGTMKSSQSGSIQSLAPDTTT